MTSFCIFNAVQIKSIYFFYFTKPNQFFFLLRNEKVRLKQLITRVATLAMYIYIYFKSQTRVSDQLVLISVMQKFYLSKSHQCNFRDSNQGPRVRVQCSNITLIILEQTRAEISMTTQRINSGRGLSVYKNKQIQSRSSTNTFGIDLSVVI